jgi:hypothetical protein
MRDTIEMAREVGFAVGLGSPALEKFERLIAMARADEREGIAEMFDEPMRLVPFVQNTQGGCLICGFTPSLAAAVIRARGETK